MEPVTMTTDDGILATGITATSEAKASINNHQKTVGKNSLDCGTKYRWFFRLVNNDRGERDFMTVAILSRDISKELGLNGKYDTTMSILNFKKLPAGNYADLTKVAPYERIARVLHKADCEYQKSRIERTRRADAIDAGIDTNSEQFIREMAVEVNKVDLKYFGDRDTNTYATVKPLIGGLKPIAYTELVCVPLTETGVPEYSKAERLAYVLNSDVKLDRFKELIKAGLPEDEDFYEVHINYGFGTNDHAEASRKLKFEVVSEDDMLRNKYPNGYDKLEQLLDSVADNYTVLKNRCPGVAYSPTDDEVVQAFKTYVSNKSVILRKIDFEAPTTMAAAKDFIDTGIADMDLTVQQKLLALVGEDTTTQARAEAISTDNNIDCDVEKVTATQTVTELMDSVKNTSSNGDLGAFTQSKSVDDI